MTTWSAGGGGTAVRRAYGVLLALCVALAVLVHHETFATSTSSLPTAVHAAHAVHATAGGTAPSVSDTSPHNADGSGCAEPGTQHCATASVDTVQLAVPGRSAFDPLAHPLPVAAGRTPGAAVGRAPPDLSVLSRLRL